MNSLKSIHDIITTDSKDYSLSKRDVYLYGIIVGWNDESWDELSTKFNIPDEEIKRIIKLNIQFDDLAGGVELSCSGCKFENYSRNLIPCSECIRSSDLSDNYESAGGSETK